MFRKIKEYIRDYFEAIGRMDSSRNSMNALAPLIIPMFFFFLIIAYVSSHWTEKTQRIKSKLDKNRIVVETIGFDSSDKVIIQWTCQSFCDTLIVYEKGEAKNLDFKVQGDNVFIVQVNEQVVSKKIQHKRSYWPGFRYHFIITKEENIYHTELVIDK